MAKPKGISRIAIDDALNNIHFFLLKFSNKYPKIKVKTIREQVFKELTMKDIFLGKCRYTFKYEGIHTNNR